MCMCQLVWLCLLHTIEKASYFLGKFCVVYEHIFWHGYGCDRFHMCLEFHCCIVQLEAGTCNCCLWPILPTRKVAIVTVMVGSPLGTSI